MITKVQLGNIEQAAIVHSVSWIDSHKSFCSPEFLALHTPKQQRLYLESKIKNGAEVYMLEFEKPVGIVSIDKNLIEDLYVLPEERNKGYGSELLHFAIGKCAFPPTLWILNNNPGARRLYERFGFFATGNINQLSESLYELELEKEK